MRKKLVVKSHRIRNNVLMISLVLFAFIGIGYATLSTHLNISGLLGVSKVVYYPDGSVFSIVSSAAKNRVLAKEYTGEHRDSFTEEPTQPIYYWTAENTEDGDIIANEILNQNNILFANHCWQILRTTDTGGVKLIYNGEAENDQCLDTRGTHIGYQKAITQTLSSSYYYGSNYDFDGTEFHLGGNVSTGTIETGKYTCMQTSISGTCTTLYLVDSQYSGSSYYVLPITTGSHYSQFGTLQYNYETSSPSDIGYMYNARYTNSSRSIRSSESVMQWAYFSTSYYYSDSYSYDPSTGYTLVDPFLVNSANDYPSLEGKYTLLNTTDNYSANSIYYIVDPLTSGQFYYIQLYGGNDWTAYNIIYTFGDSFIDNGDGTYTLQSTTEVERVEWEDKFNKISSKYVCKSAVNNTCSSLGYVTWFHMNGFEYIPVTYRYKYSNSVHYNNSTHQYSLDEDSSVFLWRVSSETDLINSSHYTCFNKTGLCSTVYYVYNEGDYIRYISLTNGKDIEDAMDDMLLGNNINVKNSIMKTGVEAWYQKYLMPYDNAIEDVIYCNNRQIQQLGGWDPNGGSVYDYLEFDRYDDYYVNDTNLKCDRVLDQFSVSNSSAPLSYKVGLATLQEMNLLNNYNLSNTSQKYWIFSVGHFGLASISMQPILDGGGHLIYYGVNNDYGVRPVISLRAGSLYYSGDGSKENPYVVTYNE